MRDNELFIYGLIALAWIIYQVIRRVMKPPRPLGTIAKDPPAPQPAAPRPEPRSPETRSPEPLLDTQWGRQPAPSVPALPPRPAIEPFQWSVDAAQAELATAREVASRQAQARLARTRAAPAARHPHWPRLYTPHDLRDAVVLSAVIGPCRALEPWQPPQEPR